MVTGKNQNVIMIPEKPSLDLEPESNSNQEINKESPYLSFPTRRAVSEGFNSSPNKPPTSAVKIVIKVSNEKIEKVRVAIEAIWIEVSMRMINELTEVLNVPIELSNLEHKEFKKFLKNSILQEGFKEIAGNFNHLFESMFPVNKESTYTTLRNSAALKRTNSNRNENLVKNFELTLSMSRLTVRLLETKLDFLVVFDEILVEMIKSQIEASIYGFSLKPYPEKSYIYKDLINKMEGDNKEFPLVRIVRDKRSHNIEIFLNRMQFIVVNRYMEELIGFKNQVASKFNDLKKQLISKVKIEKEVEELNSLESSQRHKPVLLIIHGSDLQIVIPQHSSSLDAITLLIKSVKITRNSDRISANFPDFNSSSPSIVQKIDNKLLVFEPDTINPQEVPVDIFDIELNDLDAYFNYSFMKKSPLLFAKKLKLIITKPIDALHAYDSNEKWRFKDMVEIEDIEDLKMDLNMGAIDIALSIFKDNNREEDKEIYEFLKDVYEKIMMELDIEEIDIEIETLEVQPGALKKESIIIVEKREEEGELE